MNQTTMAITNCVTLSALLLYSSACECTDCKHIPEVIERPTQTDDDVHFRKNTYPLLATIKL